MLHGLKHGLSNEVSRYLKQGVSIRKVVSNRSQSFNDRFTVGTSTIEDDLLRVSFHVESISEWPTWWWRHAVSWRRVCCNSWLASHTHVSISLDHPFQTVIVTVGVSSPMRSMAANTSYHSSTCFVFEGLLLDCPCVLHINSHYGTRWPCAKLVQAILHQHMDLNRLRLL